MVYAINSPRAIFNLFLLVLAGFFSISGCSGDNVLTSAPRVEEPSAEIKPADERAPLSRLLEVSTPVETRVSIDISDGVNTSRVEFDELNTGH